MFGVLRKTFVCTTAIQNVEMREAEQMIIIIHDHDENVLHTVRHCSTNVHASAVFYLAR